MAVYYFVFKWFILKFDVKIPGRDDSDDVKLVTKKDYEAAKKGIVVETGNANDDNTIGK